MRASPACSERHAHSLRKAGALDRASFRCPYARARSCAIPFERLLRRARHHNRVQQHRQHRFLCDIRSSFLPVLCIPFPAATFGRHSSAGNPQHLTQRGSFSKEWRNPPSTHVHMTEREATRRERSKRAEGRTAIPILYRLHYFLFIFMRAIKSTL